MKTTIAILSGWMSFVLSVNAQENRISESPGWGLNAEMNLYFLKDDFIAVPVLQADKNKLHLEGRYNYEDLQTFSAWVGRNFTGGGKFEYRITPMIGGVVGQTNGVAPGLEMTFIMGHFELYTESEFLIDAKIANNNYLYNWSDLTYSPNDRLWFGISGQRTRLYKTALDIQRGLLLGGALKNWELTGYLYNVGFDNPFVLMTVSTKF